MQWNEEAEEIMRERFGGDNENSYTSQMVRTIKYFAEI